MILSKVVAAGIAAGGFAAAGLLAPAMASADSFGSHQTLTDVGGAVVQDWTVTGLKKSSDTLPGIDVQGTLYEATATVKAKEGSVTPLIPNFHARNGEANYDALWYAFAPQGISGATLEEGDSSTGKLYFDVNGPAPTSVVYNNGVADLLTWGR